MKRIIFLILIVFLTFFGCNQNNNQATSTSQKITELKNINVAEFKKLKEQYSDKVILVNFFASWCPPCRQETPGFIKVYNKLKDSGFVILGFSIDDNIADAIKFVNEIGITYPVFHADRSLESYFNINTIPTSIFYIKGGKLYNLHVGYIDDKTLENYVKELLSK
ncbi:redoxin domain-containing protein [Deferribacter autotrophicus]|uniref:Redoxin domain-containing protein n=1 Tax=Deferribacter autotrophicus TaxID=500465 RepID=A0A5A8F6T0_9BACT|nr:TlpA disulfide reductase family protein [Deferribacter autotrophicus]KAA0258559.1 redoxin domain-containing protein [Deferribacter autotrophicus]